MAKFLQGLRDRVKDATDDRPAGDTDEAHDEISPHDLPPDHPGRKAAEEHAAAGDGTTPGA